MATLSERVCRYIPGESRNSAGHHGCELNSEIRLAMAQWAVDVDIDQDAGSGSRKVVGGHSVIYSEPRADT